MGRGQAEAVCTFHYIRPSGQVKLVEVDILSANNEMPLTPYFDTIQTAPLRAPSAYGNIPNNLPQPQNYGSTNLQFLET